MRILAIDGGGIRGLIPAVVLAEIERRSGRPIAESFDLIAGTSTGGILACALVRPGPDGTPMAAAELAGIYEREGPEIFSRSLLRRVTSIEGLVDERYDDAGLVAALERHLGDTPLSAATADVLITAYEIEQRAPFFFRSARARSDPAYDYLLTAAARATAAAPTYFEPALVRDLGPGASWALIDGGVFAINPALCAYADVAAAGRASEIELLVSLGTGMQTNALRYADVRGWGQLEWARPILDVVFDGMADAVEFQAGALLGPERHVRLQVELEASDRLDDASAANLRALRADGERLLRARAADVDRIVDALA